LHSIKFAFIDELLLLSYIKKSRGSTKLLVSKKTMRLVRLETNR